MYVTMNGTMIEAKQACVSPLGAGYLHGYGLFETIKVQGGEIHFLKQHLARLENSCKQLNMPWVTDHELLGNQCRDLIRANGLHNGSLKVLYTKGVASYDLLLSTRLTSYGPERYQKGFRLCLADSRRNPQAKLTYHKSSNYLESLLAREQAAEDGYDEAIFLNQSGMVCEGTCTNIFFVKDRILYTPAIECGLLPGILRQSLIDLAASLGMDLETGEYGLDSLQTADEVFLTNSLMDIMPVSGFQQKQYDLQSNEITRYLQRKCQEVFYPSAHQPDSGISVIHPDRFE